MVLEDARTIGAEARRIRHRRGLSLDVVAGFVGITPEYLSMLERGLRGFNRRGLIEKLAEALGCSVADLTGQPYHQTDRNAAGVQASLSTIRLMLNDFGPMDVPDLTPRPSEELASLADRANELCGQANYPLAGHGVGALLAQSQASALTVAADHRDRAFTAAVTACFVAGVVSSRAGHIDLAATAAQRGDDLPQHQDNPTLVGFARWYWACELISTGARTRAHAVLSEGIDDLTPAVQFSAADARAAELGGRMHLQQARAAARHQRADEAHAHLDEAARAGWGSATGCASTSGPRTSRRGGCRSGWS